MNYTNNVYNIASSVFKKPILMFQLAHWVKWSMCSI